jgi:hypothetical protein
MVENYRIKKFCEKNELEHILPVIELCISHRLHPNVIANWKNKLLNSHSSLARRQSQKCTGIEIGAHITTIYDRWLLKKRRNNVEFFTDNEYK